MRADRETGERLAKMAAELGLRIDPVRTAPANGSLRLQPVLIALWDGYGESMPSGRTRWLLKQF